MQPTPTYGSQAQNAPQGQVNVFNPNTGQPLAGAGSFNPNNGQSLGLSSPNANIVNNTPVNNTPNAGSLGKTSSVVIPPPPQGTSAAANAAIGASQGAILGLVNQDVQNQEAAFNAQKNETTGLINNYLNKGQDQLNMENAAGVPQLKSLSNSLNNQYLTQGAAYNSQYNSILNKTGITREQAAQQISDLQQQHGYDLTNTAIQASIASTNYTNAENIINHQIELKYAPIKDAIDFGMQFLSQNKDLLSAAQTRQFNAQLQVQQETYNQGVYNDHLIKDTQVQMIKDAAAQGASQETLDNMGSIMAKGGTIGDVAGASDGKLQQGSYTPVQTGYDPNTGLPIYSGFNQKTGQLEVKNGGKVLGQTGSTDTTIMGADGTSYQMGASTTMGAYASATQTQVNNIKATTSKIQTTVGNITDVKSAQLALNSVAPSSPVTGAMVMSAAQKYGVDPATIIGVMQAETQCGTDGSKGAKECNWGNVGNTDLKMKTGQSVAMKPQEGVDAIAKNLSQRKVTQGQNDPAQATNLTPQQIAAQSIKNAPAYLQPAMGTSNATGAIYIDSSKVPSAMQIVSQNYASQTKIPILNADQVAIVNGIDEAMRNITQVVAPAWADIAQNRLGTNVSIANYPFSKLFDTQYYQKTNTFNANRESLAQQVKALSGSAPRLGLLATAENALPTAVGGSGSKDTFADGQAKMQRTLELLNQGIKTFLPNATPVSLPVQQTTPAPVGKLNGQTYQLGKDGNYHLVTQ